MPHHLSYVPYQYVTVAYATMLYALFTDVPIDLPKFICKSFMDCHYNSNKRFVFSHPMVITQILLHLTVFIFPKFDSFKLMSTINRCTLALIDTQSKSSKNKVPTSHATNKEDEILNEEDVAYVVVKSDCDEIPTTTSTLMIDPMIHVQDLLDALSSISKNLECHLG